MAEISSRPAQEAQVQEVVEERRGPAAASTEQEESKTESVAAKGTPFPEIVTRAPMPQTVREQFAYAQNLKEEGNFLFKQKDYVNAIKKYSKVRAFLKPMIPPKDGDENASFISMIG